MKYVFKIYNNSNSFWLFLLLFSTKINAQYNLVPNHSFENFLVCPSSLLTAAPPPPWYLPTSVNNQCCSYANECCNLNFPYTGVPFNNVSYQSFQQSKTGNAYMMFGGYSIQSFVNERSYIQTKLNDSLIGGKKYYSEFFVSLINTSSYACNNISMMLSKSAQYVDTLTNPFSLLPATAQIINNRNPIIKDTMGWVKVSGIYKAKGGEKFITIGNFKDDAHTDTLTVNFSNQVYYGSQYYLDDVSVIPLDSFCLKADAGADTTITVGDSVFVGSYTNGIDTIKWYNQAGQVIDSVAPGFWVKPTTNTTYYVEQIVNGCFTRDTINVTVKPLPLSFISFTVIPRNEESAQLQFKTANEINVSHYLVQRSTNATDFATIGTASAKNFASNEYSFTDEFSIPLLGGVRGGLVYYRIVGIDKDGKITYSLIKSINIQHKSSNITVFPNPAKDYINIEGKDIKEIKLINQLGQVVKQQIFTTPTNSVLWRVGDAKGMYILNIVTTKGDIVNEKIIIQ